MGAVIDKAQQPGHVEAWGPLLLEALIAKGPKGLSGQESAWLDWAVRRDLGPQDYGPLLGDGSWNHPQMSQSCRVWHPETQDDAVAWFVGLLERQLGLTSVTEDEIRLACLGGNEPLSVEYEGFRVGAYASTVLWAIGHPAHPLASRLRAIVTQYCATLAAVLDLGATDWRDESNFQARGGRQWYTGPMVSPVGERSVVGWYQNDLGPFLSFSRGMDVVSAREDWPMRIVRRVWDDAGPPFGEAVPLSSVRIWAPMHWLRWANGTVCVRKESRQNTNTACAYASFANAADHTMTVLYPWREGREGARHQGGAGSCRVEPGDPPRVIAEVGGQEESVDLPRESPVSAFVGDMHGIRPEPLPY